MYRYVHTVKKIKSRFGNRQEKELTGFSLSSLSISLLLDKSIGYNISFLLIMLFCNTIGVEIKVILVQKTLG